MIRKFYTIQNIAAWNEARLKGFLEGNKDYIWDYFLKAYSWMMDQMERRIPSYKGEFPVWLWAERPDLRRGGYLNPDERGILLQVNIEEERVLLSDFESWHSVLMDGPVSDNEEEWEAIEQGKYHISKEKSWERIFDIKKEKEIGRIPTIQGVTGRLYIHEIKPIKEFVSRYIKL